MGKYSAEISVYACRFLTFFITPPSPFLFNEQSGFYYDFFVFPILMKNITPLCSRSDIKHIRDLGPDHSIRMLSNPYCLPIQEEHYSHSYKFFRFRGKQSAFSISPLDTFMLRK